MLDSLKEKIGKILCFFGCHYHLRYKKNGYLTSTKNKRQECDWNGPEFKMPLLSIPDHLPTERTQERTELSGTDQKMLKMYILIREDTPANIVPLIAAHTSIGTYREFEPWLITQKWFNTELQKTVICKVSAEQFEKAKEYGEYFITTEVHHQELGELGLGFRIRAEYPKFFKFLPLYKIE